MTDSRNACHFCSRDISEDEPLWRLQIRTGYGARRNGLPYPVTATVSACAQCAEREMPAWQWWWASKAFELREDGDHTPWSVRQWIIDSDWYDVTPGDTYSRCTGCGRQLGRTSFWPARSCSDDCQRAARNARRRIQPAEHVCPSCGEPFTPPRSDARYCSPACRQKAYRARVASPGAAAR